MPPQNSGTALFGVTIFLSACLLFVVQPLISKLILPWFGGSAAIWITCILFFEVLLLVGYGYAHLLCRWLDLRRQGYVHVALLVASLLALPILPNPRWQPTRGGDPTWLVLGALLTSVGLPYALLSSTTPLLQNWFARSRTGAIPYRYFALSNAGSLLALLSYPVAVEPVLTGRRQAVWWSVAYGTFVVLCAGTAWIAARSGRLPSAEVAPDKARAAISDILVWLALAAGPSALLLVVTNLLTQNIAPMPLMWVLPLGVYLLTFTLCFERVRWYRRIIFLALVLPAIGCLVHAAGPSDAPSLRVMVPTLLASLFVCCMVSHGELARRRPAPERLTSFYLALALGGALGGISVGLIAPHILPAMLEYAVVFVFCPAVTLFVLWRERREWNPPRLVAPFWYGGCAVVIVLAGYVSHQTWREVHTATYLARNFYGALRVQDFTHYHRKVRQLSHGTIVHGLEIENALFMQTPTTYYGWDSGIGLTWRTLRANGPLRMGVVGLGTGTLATYGRAGDVIRFYDINPLIPEIARNYFEFVAGSPAHIEIEVGDARLNLAHESSQQFDILAVDAFSGDAIPLHLLSREAFDLYRRHLKRDGVLAVHVSNRYLDLAPIARLGARAAGFSSMLVESDEDDRNEISAASWVLASNRSRFFDSPLLRGETTLIHVPPGLHAWTDDFSNLWQVLKFSPDE